MENLFTFFLYENRFCKIPAIIAIIIDVITLYNVKNSPKKLYVANIESIPVIGVDIKKLETAPFDAPSFCKLLAKGITLQEQTGIGIPRIVAFITELNELFPRCLNMKSVGSNSFRKPAINNPIKIYGLIAFARLKKFSEKFINISIKYPFIL